MQREHEAQAKHDEMVGSIARDFVKKGFRVKADIEGYERPGMIRGYRPDVIAFKDGQRKIVEVETADTSKTSRAVKQQEAFRAEADNSETTTFTKRVAK
ncbi:MAG: hypothetical protein K9K64_11340 [Desulfohalobiaceae bacterium]|nr:hypothetical protein [Desulfohalobiaceae bacterium]MCF8106069.1 hypothetical protein [Desulfohalobiaceae bacterium]